MGGHRLFLSGDEAIARGAWEAGVKVAAAYPGTPSTDIVDSIAKYPEVYAQWSPNEKVAMEVGIGASRAGMRVLVAMKHVGLNVAADPFMTFSYTGVGGGTLIVSADDPHMHSSQNEQDNRPYSRMASVPMIEPADSEECRRLAAFSYGLSERYDTPVLMRITTRIAHGKGPVLPGERVEAEPVDSWHPDTQKWVMLPINARVRHAKMLERMELLKEFSEEWEENRVFNMGGDPEIGFISSGIPYQYVREAFPHAPVLKLTMTHPLPTRKILDFAKRVKRLYVVEELEPFLETAIRAMGIEVVGKEAFPRLGELSPELVYKGVAGEEKRVQVSVPQGLPPRLPTLCAGCPHRGVFTVLRKLKAMVMGDIGCYTLGGLPPLSALHACVCMGAGIGMAHGATMAGAPSEKTVAIIGDSTFLHSGITGVMDIVYNKGVATVIVLDNATTAMTGKQDHPGTGVTLKKEKTKKVSIEAVCRAVGVDRVRYIDPYDLEETERVLKEELAAREPSVVITTRPCTLITKERPGVVYEVDEERCIACGKCSSVACMAVFLTGKNGDRVAKVDPLLCYGCGVCAQVCPVNAIVASNGSKRG